MSPKVRLPLVELSEQSKGDITTTMAAICDAHSDCLIGTRRTADHAGQPVIHNRMATGQGVVGN